MAGSFFSPDRSRSVALPAHGLPVLGTKHDPQSPLPSIGDDEGTAFAVGVITVDDKLAIKVQP